MTKEALNERNLDFLNEINEMLKAAGLETEVDEIGDVEVPQSVVCEMTAGLNSDEVLSLFFFLPNEEEANVSYLVESITLADNVEGDEKKLQMLQAVNILNNQITYGAFMFDSTLSILSYRYVIPVHTALSKDDAMNLIYNEIFTGIGLVNVYVAPLLTLLEDSIDWDTYQGILVEYNEPIE